MGGLEDYGVSEIENIAYDISEKLINNNNKELYEIINTLTKKINDLEKTIQKMKNKEIKKLK